MEIFCWNIIRGLEDWKHERTAVREAGKYLPVIMEVPNSGHQPLKPLEYHRDSTVYNIEGFKESPQRGSHDAERPQFLGRCFSYSKGRY